MKVDMTRFNRNHPLVQLGFRVRKPPVYQTMINDYYACKRKAFWRHIMGLVRTGSMTPEALFIGQCLHDAMRHLGTGSTMDFVTRRMNKLGQEEMEKAMGGTGVMPANADKRITWSKSKALAMAIVFDKQVTAARRKKGLITIIAVEKEIRAIIPAKVLQRFGCRAKGPIEIAGTLDVISEETKPTRGHTTESEAWKKSVVVIDDYKTTSDPPPDRAKMAALEVQPYMYRMLQASLKGERVATKFRNYIIMKPGIRLCRGESLTEYIARMKQWYKDYTIEHPNEPPTCVSTIDYDAEMYPINAMKQIIEVWRTTNPRGTFNIENFPMTGAPYQCKQRGNWCPYIDLCFGDPTLWPDQVGLRFKQEFRYVPRGHS